jgi:hypothetical protein
MPGLKGANSFYPQGLKRFYVAVNFVLIIMKSNVVISQILIFFPKNGWIILP